MSFDFSDPITLQEILTFAAIVVALIGPYLFENYKESQSKKGYKSALKIIIDQLIETTQRTQGAINLDKMKKVNFSLTQLTELAGYRNILEKLILGNCHLRLNNSADVNFLGHYLKNLTKLLELNDKQSAEKLTHDTLPELKNKQSAVNLTHGTVDKLIMHAKNAIK